MRFPVKDTLTEEELQTGLKSVIKDGRKKGSEGIRDIKRGSKR